MKRHILSQFLSWSAHCAIALSIAFLLTLPRNVPAQQAAASINGIIRDSSGAVVEGAAIAHTDVATGVSRTTVSNASGNYVFVDVNPAPYTLNVAKAGLNTIAQPRFRLQVNQTATLNFTLPA